MTVHSDIVSPVRWVGGKRSLVDQILPKIPVKIKTYVEPFLGGGSIFLEVLKRGLAEKYVVADINHHVMGMWSDLRNDYSRLISELRSLKDSYDSLSGMESKRERYYEFRRRLNPSSPPSGETYLQSALFMVLGKTAFNALVRYNGKGGFNSAFGKRETVVMDFENLGRLHDALSSVEVSFLVGDFASTVSTLELSSGDFVYLDPPYHALGDRKVDDKTYGKDGFVDSDEKRMREFCDRIVGCGADFLMSNHECPEILEYFSGYPYEKLFSYKCFTGKAASRKETKEILLGNLVTPFKIGDRVVKNPLTWLPSDFDSWAGHTVGTIVEPPWSHVNGVFDSGEDASVDVRWDWETIDGHEVGGRCFQRCSELLKAPAGVD